VTELGTRLTPVLEALLYQELGYENRACYLSLRGIWSGLECIVGVSHGTSLGSTPGELRGTELGIKLG
jgi:hypothetical protein